MAYQLFHGMEIRIVCIFNTYGTRMRLNDGRALPTFMKQALNSPVNIGNLEEVTNFDFARKIIELTGSNSRIGLRSWQRMIPSVQAGYLSGETGVELGAGH